MTIFDAFTFGISIPLIALWFARAQRRTPEQKEWDALARKDRRGRA